MQQLKLVPDTNGNVELVEKFWHMVFNFKGKTVPPLLAYARINNQPRQQATGKRQNDIKQNLIEEPVDILDPFIAEMLKLMGNVFREYNVDYYLVGALARDIRLSAHESFAAKRRTKDVDIAVMLDDEDLFYAVKDALVATGHFEESENKPIKLIYKGGIEVDLLPFGEIETEDRELQLSRMLYW